jgi:hypothetical protein
VETACKPVHEGIHYLVEIFQDVIHYIRANDKCSAIPHAISVKNLNFMRVFDIILKFAKM